MAMPLIEMKDVTFSYGNRTVLKKVSFQVEKGSVTAIMGGSGSGKTTIMRLIAGQIFSQSGQVLIDGKDITTFDADALYEHRRRMGVLFQHGALFTDLNVFDNVAFPMRELTSLHEDIINDLVKLKLNAVGLHGVEALMPSELSGGMARRVALARTIALDPELILYDEPFTGLDPISLGVISHLIDKTSKALNSTSIMVTHDIEKSLEIVDNVVFVAHGEIIFSGSKDQMKGIDSPWVKQFINGLPYGPVAFKYAAGRSLKEDLLG